MFGALQRAEGKIEFIQARYEEMAAFMAAAHAKFTGELGVCIATSGPGASPAFITTSPPICAARVTFDPIVRLTGGETPLWRAARGWARWAVGESKAAHALLARRAAGRASRNPRRERPDWAAK